MKVIRQVVEIGNSLGITLPKNALEKQGISKGDYVELEYQKQVIDNEKQRKSNTKRSS